MKSVVKVCCVLILAIGVSTDCPALDGQRYIVRFKREAALTLNRLGSNRVAQSQSIQALRDPSGVRGQQIDTLPLDGSAIMQLSPQQHAALAADPQVESVERDVPIKAFFQPNDPSYSLQKNLNGPYGISGPLAWDITTGSPSQLVAIIDSGTDFTHQDLQGVFWSNPGEIAANGVDDDKNGFIDDVNGYDFGSDIGDSDPSDENGHGTHVTGIIAAVGNNALGTVGVAWNTKVIPVKCLDDGGNGYVSYLVKALDYVSLLKDQGYPISVVNMSLGTEEASDALNRAVERATARGLFLVAAAGNNYGRNNDQAPSFPANIESPNVIAVTASDTSGELAEFSNIGPRNVDLAAPGTRILSTVPLLLKGVEYDYLEGTSMAAPHVSGIAALMLAANASLTPTLLKSILMATVTPRKALVGKMVSGGIANAYSAVAIGVASKTRYRMVGSVKRRKRGVGQVSIALRLSSGATYRRTALTSNSGRFAFSDLPPGTYTITASRSGMTFLAKSKRLTLSGNKQVSFTVR